MASKMSWFKNEIADNEVLIIVKAIKVVYSEYYFCC